MMALRYGVLWFGQTPSDDAKRAFRERQLILAHFENSASDADFSSARGAVFALPAHADGNKCRTLYKEGFARALRHGIKPVILGDLACIASIDKFLKSLPYDTKLTAWARNREVEIAEEIARSDPGPRWSGSVKIEGDEDLSSEDKILLRRAFSDCSEIKLTFEPGGRSAKVFRGYARLNDSRVGPAPLPFFVKIDRLKKIRRELRNYRDCTTVFIPFNQRPNLDFDRCAAGVERGIIVGNFIEESEPLRDLVERGTARQALHSLFSGALRGWRIQAYELASNTVYCRIVESLPGCFPSKNPRRLEAIKKHAHEAKSFGANLSPEELEETLKSLPPVKHRRAFMHGDLHGENVRVYESIASLIDFTSVQQGPLVADPAALDVSLVMSARKIRGADWETFVLKAYALEALLKVPPPVNSKDSSAAFWSYIRLIRHIGLGDQLSETEYATAVALYLLRHASFYPDSDEEPSRRPFAYLLAEKLSVTLSSVTPS
jgi:hypothetical protein